MLLHKLEGVITGHVATRVFEKAIWHAIDASQAPGWGSVKFNSANGGSEINLAPVLITVQLDSNFKLATLKHACIL